MSVVLGHGGADRDGRTGSFTPARVVRELGDIYQLPIAVDKLGQMV
jgi:hypothetical protein